MKYKNTKVITEDGTFDSKKEYMRWDELRKKEALGEIVNLRRQVPFELIPTQYANGKCKERKLVYIADFAYEAGGKVVVEDVKPRDKDGNIPEMFKNTASYKTFVIKRKLMLWKFGIEVKEV